MIRLDSLQLFIKQEDSWSAVHHSLSGIENGKNPGLHISKHFLPYASNKGLQKHNAMNGLVFEAIVYDALVRFDVPKDRIRIHVQFVEGRDIEGDIVIDGNSTVFALGLKCSARERWAQWDRAAIALKYRAEKYEYWGIHGIESKSKPFAEPNIKHCERWESKSFAMEGVLSMFSDQRISTLVRRIVDDCEGTVRQKKASPVSDKGRQLFTT